MGLSLKHQHSLLIANLALIYGILDTLSKCNDLKTSILKKYIDLKIG